MTAALHGAGAPSAACCKLGVALAESSQGQTNPIHDSVAAVVILGACAGVWWQTERMQSASAMFPRLIASIAAVLAVIYLLRSLVRMRTATRRPTFFIYFPRWLLAFGLVAAYALLFPVVGFITATLVFVPLMALATGVRRPLFTAVLTVVFAFSSYGLFAVALRRYLPSEALLNLLP